MMFKSDVPNPNPAYFEYTKMTIRAWEVRKDMLMPLLKFHEIDICGSQELRNPQLEYLFPDKDYAYVDSAVASKVWMKNVVIYRKDKYRPLSDGFFMINPGKKNGRYCQWVKFLDLNTNGEFFVFNLHNDHLKPELRLAASKLVLEKIPEIAKGLPFLLTGDFNAYIDSGEMKPYSESAIMSEAKSISVLSPYGPKTSGCFPYEKFPAITKGAPIDFIFVSKGIKVLKFGVLTDCRNGSYPSDHFPVVAKIEIPKIAK